MRRIARILLAVGALVLVMCAVAFAQDPTPTAIETPAETPAPTTTPTPTPVLTATPAVVTATPTPSPTASPSPSPSPSPTPTASPSPSPTATPSPTPSRSPSPKPAEHAPRAAAPQPTPPPEPTPTPPDQFTGASLTICHYTSSGYEPVVITADQFSGYYDDDRNVIPAPSSGCAGVTDAKAAQEQPVTVCHRNPDGTFTLYRYPAGDLGEHEEDRGDLIPAPGGDCPGGAVAVVTPTPTPEPTASPDPEPEPTVAPLDLNDLLLTKDPRPTRGHPRRPATVTAPATRSVVESGAAATPVVTTAGELPFTGLDLGLLAAVGLSLVLTGAGLRLLAQPAVGVTR